MHKTQCIIRALAHIRNSHSDMSSAKHPDPLNPRKQPAQSRSSKTVGVILEAAARILEERGFDGYTTNAIAQRAGVSIGSLYQYFPGKDAITIALIERESTVLLEAVTRACTLEDWQDALKAMIRAATEHQLARPRLARLLDFEESRLATHARNPRVANILHSAVTEMLDRRLKRKSKKSAVIALDVLAITRGLSDAAGERGETDPDNLEKRIRQAVFGFLELS
jgi:AcrR family transcriptional regulator